MELNYLIAVLIAFLLLLSFLSGIDAAFFSASRLAIELKKKQAKYSGRVWYNYFQNPSRFIATGILVYNIGLIIYTYLWWLVLGTVWDYWSIENIYLQIAATAVAACLSLLLIEFFVRIFFHAKPNAILGSGFVTFLISGLFSLFSWIAANLSKASEWTLKYIFNVKVNQKTEAFSRMDIDLFAQQMKGNEQGDKLEKNNEIFENIISLSDTKIKACMIPRREIVGVDINTSIESLTKIFSDTKLSKLVVYKDSIDNIEGYVHQLDLFKRPNDIQSVLLPIPIVPDSMNATDLLNKFSRERKSIAWVIDEFGGTAGIVTMEDLLEEIFGDIYDEFDVAEDFVEKQIGLNEFLFSGRLSIDTIEEKYHLRFKRNSESETLSGYIISRSGTIPKQKDRIIIDDYQFDIVSVAKTRIEAVRLKVLR